MVRTTVDIDWDSGHTSRLSKHPTCIISNNFSCPVWMHLEELVCRIGASGLKSQLHPHLLCEQGQAPEPC